MHSWVANVIIRKDLVHPLRHVCQLLFSKLSASFYQKIRLSLGTPCILVSHEWAVGKHFNIPEEDIIEDCSYDHSGEFVRQELRSGWHSGVSGLHYAKYTAKNDLRLVKSGTPKNVFPAMDFWTADEVLNHFNAELMAV